jgi:hypothetical protein
VVTPKACSVAIVCWHHGVVTVPTEPWDPEEQLFRAVRQEFGLWELAEGTECHMHGAPVFHPAPEPALASERLLGWLDAGLIELVEDRTPGNWHEVPEKERRRLTPTWFPAVPSERARAVLAEPSHWRVTEPGRLLALRPTDHGLAVGSEEWGTSLADGGPRPPWRRPLLAIGYALRRRRAHGALQSRDKLNHSP